MYMQSLKARCRPLLLFGIFRMYIYIQSSISFLHLKGILSLCLILIPVPSPYPLFTPSSRPAPLRSLDCDFVSVGDSIVIFIRRCAFLPRLIIVCFFFSHRESGELERRMRRSCCLYTGLVCVHAEMAEADVFFFIRRRLFAHFAMLEKPGIKKAQQLRTGAPIYHPNI